ncbi:UBA/THIF-type NAD/FAD binding protein [Xylanimonas cellulosilytica DSM 15894]|uniref:UBA/THIF-type NAD/FAD binding protein n=1 Tax=Xylanimonas cellulosilytica (strain DSM 15894 / JCM 12276 / CECT 5975 / KCTC 9989 / LMG 20990 / NBRC 107835 / XIL07) TaxID=446471 RepID=D1BRZ8_XYLCX|nr:ThiF family adenylyltransferase [Xylanimonas cellulosilytica]ACZ30490.1 UBA/THIF-type NAD/FAD binding protein [Xylanimonas cellulosilytica DSM 15894]
MLTPLVEPGPDLATADVVRYARHLALPGVGADGQRRLAAARVLVVGAGGLGSPVLLYLAAAGVGTLGVVDDDVVDVTNLQRQVVHGVGDVGRPKTTSARETVAAVNPAVRVVEHRERLGAANALALLRGYDVVVDGSDNFATRYLVSDAAELLGLPVVWGGLHQFQGQVSVFWAAPTDGEGVTYRDVFPEPPPPALAPDCATGGVLGALCGTLGSTMAAEAIKLIVGAGRPLLGRLAVHDALDATWRYLVVGPDPSRPPVTALLDDAGYATFCGLPAAARPEGGDTAPTSVSAADLAAARTEPGAFVLDVREAWEAQATPFDSALLIPSGAFLGTDPAPATSQVAVAAGERTVYVVCRSGVRSARAASVLRAAGVDARDVVGGLDAWAREVGHPAAWRSV